MPLTKITGDNILSDTNSFNLGTTLVGGGTSTGTANQNLQVTGGAYVSGSVGIGTTNPGSGINLDVLGGEIRAGRIDAGSEGGQVSFSRSTDNATAWYIDVYGNTSTPQLRFVDVSNAAVRATFDGSGNFQFNSGYGSVATAYGCRAWVNFNGTTASPSTIRASGNVSSVTKNGTGDYTVNFTTAMPDANYCPVTQSVGESTTSLRGGSMIMGTWASGATLKTTTQLRIYTGYTFTTGGAIDSAETNVAIFR